MKRLTLALALLFGATVLPATVSAAVVQYSQTSCSAIYEQMGYPKPFVCLAEHDDFGGNKLILTGSSDVASLGSLTHSPVGYCAPKTSLDTDNWNDCITSVWMKLGTSDSVCIYRNANYNQMARRWATTSTGGPTWTLFDDDLGSTDNDTVSSIMVQQSGAQCGEGGLR